MTLHGDRSMSSPPPTLPDLRTREAIRGFLRGLATQLGASLGDARVARELDSRDQLAGLRDKFHVPLISELLEKEEERAPGGQTAGGLLRACEGGGRILQCQALGALHCGARLTELHCMGSAR